MIGHLAEEMRSGGVSVFVVGRAVLGYADEVAAHDGHDVARQE